MNICLSSLSMEWRTPPEVFKPLNDEFHFALDVASNENNHLTDKFFTTKDNGLMQSWRCDGAVWCNPPYGRQIGKWVEKAYRESQKTKFPIVMLIPARTDTRWFHDYILNKADIRFVRGRIQFLDENGNKHSNSTFPSMIVIYNFLRKGVNVK